MESSLTPFYQIVGPVAITIVLIMFLAGVGKMAIEILVRGYAILRVHGCGVWMIAAFWLFHLAMAPFNYGWELGDKAGKGVGKAMEVEASANTARKSDPQEIIVGNFDPEENENAIPWRS